MGTKEISQRRHILYCEKCGGIGQNVAAGEACECGGTFIKDLKIVERPKPKNVTKYNSPGITLKKRKYPARRP